LTTFGAQDENTLASIILAMTFGAIPKTKLLFGKPSTTISSFVSDIDGLEVVRLSVKTQLRMLLLLPGLWPYTSKEIDKVCP
jgi:hypothetical protein